MPLPKPSPELSAHIQWRIYAIEADTLGAWLLKWCKEDLNALPLHGNSAFLWAIQPNGTVLRLDFEVTFDRGDPETDPLTLYAVMEKGTLGYPELAEIVPERPPGARPCGSCKGTGTQIGPNAYETSCYGCSGLGWV